MKRGGGILIAAAALLFLLCGVSSPKNYSLQGSETDTATPTVSDLFFPAPTGTASETPSATGDPTSFFTLTDTATESRTPTGTPSESQTMEDTRTETVLLTPTETPSSTCTPSGTNSSTPGAGPAWVVISEVAWAGTAASANDEWIELWNPGAGDVDLAGWILTDYGDIKIFLSGTIGSGSFFLLERTDDTTIGNLAADQIYTGALSNSGEALFLLDPSGAVADSANGDGGAWPAGGSAMRGTMERTGAGPDSDSAWCSNDGIHRSGSDANGGPVNGTPRQAFSGFCGEPGPTATRTRTPTPTGSVTVTATLTPTPTVSPIPFPAYAVVINEVAWAGTAADSSDEWIELWNPGADSISFSGWILTDGGDISIALEGSIGPGGFFVLERGGDDTLSDIGANMLFSGGLSNAGEELRLLDPAGSVVDAAGGRPWPAGSASPAYASMERARVDPPGWATNTGWMTNGRDAEGNPVRGTPGRANSALFPTPTATKVPHAVRINEFLPKPGSDWNRDGTIDYNDEFIELYNTGSDAVDIGGWMLDDRGRGSYVIPGGTWIRQDEYLVFFRSQTHIALNDEGDEVWLLAPDGRRLDGRVYTRTRWPDSAWALFPDGVSILRLGFPPTPGEPNRLPEDILHPKKDPLPTIPVGWRRVDCDREEPLLVGDGFLTTGGEESIRAAESLGWIIWINGKCYAWSAPFAGRRAPYTNLLRGADSPFEGAGWWWESWFLK